MTVCFDNTLEYASDITYDDETSSQLRQQRGSHSARKPRCAKLFGHEFPSSLDPLLVCMPETRTLAHP
jgi:hypothetical protein